jgi:hypothetical protein
VLSLFGVESHSVLNVFYVESHSVLSPFEVQSIRVRVHSGLVPFEVESIRVESIWGWVLSGLSPFGVESIRGWVQSGLSPVRGWVHSDKCPILGSAGESLEHIVSFRVINHRTAQLHALTLCQWLLNLTCVPNTSVNKKNLICDYIKWIILITAEKYCFRW